MASPAEAWLAGMARHAQCTVSQGNQSVRAGWDGMGWDGLRWDEITALDAAASGPSQPWA